MKLYSQRNYYVYICTNLARDQFQSGITGDLSALIANSHYQNSEIKTPDNCDHLVYFERYDQIDRALDREKNLKNLNIKKVRVLISSFDLKEHVRHNMS